VIKTKLDKERREFLIGLATKISLETGFTRFENVSEEVWNDTFLEAIHPLLDDAIGEHGLGAHDIFFMGVWFGQSPRA
jgi:hypothetical protein